MPVFNNVNKLLDGSKVNHAMYYLDSAFKRIKNPALNDRYRFYGFHFIYNKNILNDYKTALLYADSMMDVANKSTNKNQYSLNFAEANFAKGDAYFGLKQFNDAYQCYYNGYLTGKKYLNNLVISDYTYRMGMIMYQKKHFKLAASYFKLSYSQSKLNTENDFPGFFRKQEVLDNIALSYRHNGQIDSALFYFNKALAYLDENKDKFKIKASLINSARGVVYGNKAEVYIQAGNFDEAAGLLKKSIAINLLNGNDNSDAELAEVKLGQIFFEKGQNDSLYGLMGNLAKQLQTVKNPEAEADYNRLLGNYFLKRNNLQKAVDHIQRYNFLKDSIAKTSNLLMESDINQQLVNYEKQHQIEALNNNNKLQIIYLYVAVFFSVMAVIIISLVYRDWKRSKMDVQTVNLLNSQINGQNGILESALKELKNSAEEKDRILRTVAHDLRNPIGGIASLTAMMAEDDYNADQKELINLVKDTSFNSLELINEILEATNIASVKLKLETVDIKTLVSNSVELLRFNAAEKGQRIILQTLNKQLHLLISREKIWRVISNLISNAIKFSPSGALINVKILEDGDHLIIAVEDNGIGIPHHLQEHVFNMFTTAQRPGTAGEKSFGLGLSICRQIMEKHNGKIWLESNGQIGTTFYLSLPLSAAHLSYDLPQKISIPTS